MQKIAIPKTREDKRARRHLRVRNTISGTAERPRLVVFRSLKHITAQLVDDTQGRTLFTGRGRELCPPGLCTRKK